MQGFEDTFEECKRSLTGAFSIYRTVPLSCFYIMFFRPVKLLGFLVC